MFCLSMVVLFLGDSFLGNVAAGGEPYRWRVGVAVVKITPSEPVYMSGFGRVDPSTSVNNDLYAKALAFEDASGGRAVLMTADLVSIGGRMTSRVCRRVMSATALQRRQILLNVSHTHAGPKVWAEDVAGRDPAAVEATRRNISRMEEKLADVILEAVSNMEPARLSWSWDKGFASFVMSRRAYTPRGVRHGTNPRAPVDRSVPVLRVDGTDGKLRAVLFGTACHAVTSFRDNFAIDPDFPGYAQRYIEKQNPGAVALYMAGCGGDAVPYPRGKLELAPVHGRALGTEVCRVLNEKLAVVRGPIRTEFEEAELPFQPPPPRKQLELWASGNVEDGWQKWFASRVLKMFDEGRPVPTHCTVPLAVWQFGDNLTLVALPCEPVYDYVPLIEKALGPANLWIAGYSNEVVGYLPSKRILSEGGYESRGIDTGPSVGVFAPETEDIVISAIKRLARRAGRPSAGPSERARSTIGFR